MSQARKSSKSLIASAVLALLGELELLKTSMVSRLRTHFLHIKFPITRSVLGAPRLDVPITS
ncbi:hypothetical protein B566_EDAN005962 [Ephemera danica]|nr:hypothetical protein B566_EDAN005962 [Ephemera danica]